MDDDRNITVGKSWPRPATPCDLIPNWEGEFRDHQDWMNFAHKRLTVASDSNGNQLSAICVDTLGRRCHNGRDMARARDEGTFPVRYFFECTPAEPARAALSATPLGNMRKENERLRNGVRQILSDMAEATGHGMAWIDHSEVETFKRRFAALTGEAP